MPRCLKNPCTNCWQNILPTTQKYNVEHKSRSKVICSRCFQKRIHNEPLGFPDPRAATITRLPSGFTIVCRDDITRAVDTCKICHAKALCQHLHSWRGTIPWCDPCFHARLATNDVEFEENEQSIVDRRIGGGLAETTTEGGGIWNMSEGEKKEMEEGRRNSVGLGWSWKPS